MRKRSQYLL